MDRLHRAADVVARVVRGPGMRAVVVSLGDAAFVIIRLPIAGRFFHRKGIFGRLAGIRIVGPRAPS